MKATKMKGVQTMTLTYRQVGDYQIPNLTVPENPKIGKYGMLRREYLRKNRDGLYTGMLLSGDLNSHLEEIDRQATEMMESLTSQMAKQENVTETLKAANQMMWVQKMNNIRNAAREIVLYDIIYAV